MWYFKKDNSRVTLVTDSGDTSLRVSGVRKLDEKDSVEVSQYIRSVSISVDTYFRQIIACRFLSDVTSKSDSHRDIHPIPAMDFYCFSVSLCAYNFML